MTSSSPAADTGLPSAPPVIDLRDGAGDATVLLRATQHDGAGALSRAEQVHAWWRRGGVILLAVLNVLDLVTTRMFMDRGVAEGNPIAKVLIEANLAGPAKFVLLAALGYLVWTRPPRIATTCLIWMVNGVYATVVAVNTWVVIVVS